MRISRAPRLQPGSPAPVTGLNEAGYRRTDRQPTNRPHLRFSERKSVSAQSACLAARSTFERFGVHFVASPRHADMLLVTGPVTRNMELALRKTYDAMPGPRLVVAVGACGCSGGIFGVNYATRGPVDAVVPVDVYIPGCPPNPHALLHGILTAVGRLPNP